MTSDYQTVEGTEPTAHGVHEPRTIKRVITPDPRFDKDHDLHMMTEIGDGVFVAWSGCRRCGVRVYDCKCTDGPKAPDHIDQWRQKRFAKDLNTRPEPSYELLPSLITWLEERGYDVTKSVKKQLEEAKPYDPNDPDFAPIDLDEEDAEAFDAALREGEPAELDVSPTLREDSKAKVDQGLDAALEKVKAARIEDFPDF